MAEILLGIVADIITKLGSSTVQQIGSACGMEKQFAKLTQRLNTVKGVLVDAEKREGESDAVKTWVGRLKHVVFDADDLMDELATHQRQCRGATRQVSDFFSSSNQFVFRLKMSRRLANIKEQVDGIIKEIPLLSLIQGKADHREEKCRWRETHSFVLTSEMVGREEDKEKIIELLVSSGNKKLLSAIAIIGIGGLGKTTVAQMVFNDKRVVEFFELKMWICVSDDFDVKLLVKKILKSLKCAENLENLELDVLKDYLHERLREKRYLLVLDDVWNDDPQKWDGLRSLLMVGAKGSVVVVTTRNRNVASAVGIEHFPFSLKGLDKNQSWNLFSKFAFEEGQERVYPSLVEIGKEIVNMCNGVPLIIRTLGAVLRHKTEERQWLSIKNNENLLLLRGGNNDHALSVLKLSYDDLPFHLKQCFAFCALFPKDYDIEKQLLVQLWMAQGYIQASDVGNFYLDELVSRSLLEIATPDTHKNISRCKMHDLIHDLTRSIVEPEVLILRDNVKEIGERVYHVSFSVDMHVDWKDLKEKHLKEKYVRTILQLEGDNDHFSNVSTVIPNFKHLRVLRLSESFTHKIPKSISKLRHLRYLDLSCCYLEALPNAITRLCHLQTLKLNFCFHLKQFPKDIGGALIDLRHLDNHMCDSLTHMPRGIGQLTLLESLPLFVVGTGSSKVGKLNELKRLNNLTKSLRISKLENVKGGKVESEEANLVGKQHIESLALEWSDGAEAQSGEDAESTIAGLQPHPNIKQLFIRGYGGKKFPSWMINNGLSCRLPNLTLIELESCSRCLILPPFVKLPHLRHLSFEGLEKVEYLDCCSSEASSFPSLRYLHLSRMPKLKELWRRNSPADASPSLPCLSELHIRYCNELACLELHSSPALVQFMIYDCPKLTSILLSPSPHLSHLDINNCPHLASLRLQSWSSIVPMLPCIKRLRVSMAREKIFLDIVTSASASSSLKYVSIEQIGDLVFLSDELHRHVSTLQTLKIRKCSRLATLPRWMANLTSLADLEIRGCPELKSFPQEMASLTTLSSLSIDYSCGSTFLPGWIGSLTSLTHLEIGSCSQLTSLPEELLSLGILRTLIIRDCPGLTTLPEWIGNFTTLFYLGIYSCPQLTSLPEEMHWLTTLQTLIIIDCPHLVDRCRGGNGEEWSKIAHVPEVKLDGKRLWRK